MSGILIRFVLSIVINCVAISHCTGNCSGRSQSFGHSIDVRLCAGVGRITGMNLMEISVYVFLLVFVHFSNCARVSLTGLSIDHTLSVTSHQINSLLLGQRWCAREGVVESPSHGALLAFSLAQMPIMFAFQFEQEALSPTYFRFIASIGNQTLAGTAGNRDCSSLVKLSFVSIGFSIFPCTSTLRFATSSSSSTPFACLCSCFYFFTFHPYITVLKDVFRDRRHLPFIPCNPRLHAGPIFRTIYVVVSDVVGVTLEEFNPHTRVVSAAGEVFMNVQILACNTMHRNSLCRCVVLCPSTYQFILSPPFYFTSSRPFMSTTVHHDSTTTVKLFVSCSIADVSVHTLRLWVSALLSPLTFLMNAARRILASCLFIASYAYIMKSWTCFIRNATQQPDEAWQVPLPRLRA
jgi:hypothetical protein